MTAKKMPIMDRYRITKRGVITERGKVIKPRRNADGVLVVNLKGPDGKKRRCPVHRLVAEAFLPEPESRDCVIFLDGDSSNIKPSNLKWVTKAEANRHALTGMRGGQRLQRGIGKNPNKGAAKLAASMAWI